MPLWVASVPRVRCALGRRTIGILQHDLKFRSRCQPSLRIPQRSYASTHVSPATINAAPRVLPQNKELYNALCQLETSAEQYVNISRIQLALRGLASEDFVVRVAVLALDSQENAQKVARLLLADPLGPVEKWEEELETATEDGKPVLLRYGAGDDIRQPNPLYHKLPTPSRVLRANNLEVLVSTLNIDVSKAPVKAALDDPLDTVLVPKLQATASSGVPTPYPVHKTLVVGKGLESVLAYGTFAADMPSYAEAAIKVAADLPPLVKEIQSHAVDGPSIINVELGAEALASFRESIANSVNYERGWFRSGMQELSRWLTAGMQPSEPTKPAVKALVSSVTDDVEARILIEDARQLQKLNDDSAATQRTAQSVLTNLEVWAEQSHTELRDQLDSALSSRYWKKLAWWKLLWRVDDVTMITSEIIEQKWLVEAEKRGVFLAGRMEQAGYANTVDMSPVVVVPEEAAEVPVEEPVAAETREPSPTEPLPVNLSTEVRIPQPWHSQLSIARAALLQESIPPLQALAQRLVLQTLSTTSLTSALSALLYVSSSSLTIFEASAVAALGLVFSLRRMQTTWEKAREMWAVGIREEGRKTLKATEEDVRWIVNNQGTRRLEAEGAEERRKAREAVERVREALKNLE
ncbi:hypothetical protein M011DRAFT_481020 [Sporormia fimetaria CBS 119925]|uniref:Mmc1 C-terminal domain-containing protein n=1 Tax=Sporormia fimetaria CBS 119925 TaxID=1340428 RepID=A0A6A6V0D0_9PLEO|nr:hypothetical protein M011DRAFT_481020 [Sporormia fimetaria CBS 119925]